MVRVWVVQYIYAAHEAAPQFNVARRMILWRRNIERPNHISRDSVRGRSQHGNRNAGILWCIKFSNLARQRAEKYRIIVKGDLQRAGHARARAAAVWAERAFVSAALSVYPGVKAQLSQLYTGASTQPARNFALCCHAS